MLTKVLAILVMATISHPGVNVGFGFAAATAFEDEKDIDSATDSNIMKDYEDIDMLNVGDEPEGSEPPDLKNLNATSCADLEGFDFYDLAGTPYQWVKEDCMEGIINTTEQFQADLTENNDTTHTLEEKLDQLAERICSAIEANSENADQEIIDACNQDPRNDEHVVDTVVRIELAKSDETEMLPDLNSSCQQMAENRDEINAGLEMLMERSSGRRRLHGESGPVTSFGYAVDMVEMMDCLCDPTNPLNEGCTLKFIRFLGDTFEAVRESSSEEVLSPDLLSTLGESFNKQTSHLRKSSPPGYEMTEDDAQALVERALVDADVDISTGICSPPGVQHTVSGYKVCLYAGPSFECAGTLATRTSSVLCPALECSAGRGVALVGELKYCPLEETVTVEVKICVDVISEVLDVIGSHISSVSSVLARFNIHGGCYRLGLLTYETAKYRAKLEVPRLEATFGHILKVGAGGEAYMHFKRRQVFYHFNQPGEWGWYYKNREARRHVRALPAFHDRIAFPPPVYTPKYVYFEVDFRVRVWTPFTGFITVWSENPGFMFTD